MESMDGKAADGAGEMSKEAEKAKKKTDNIGAAILLSFPSTFVDPTPHLAPLRDNHSQYNAVAKACLQLNQYALNGSSSTLEDTQSVESSALFHDASFATSMSGAFAALIECLQTHDDRRAKIASCKTLALVARATYARIRHSPHLFAMRDSTNNRLEDEVGTDVPMALCTAALEDPDDGVAASAIHALGILNLSSSTIPGTLVEDELLREIMSMVHSRMSPYAPTLADLQDEDTNIPQMELQTRIYENVMSPRLLQLVCRAMAFESLEHTAMSLPVLTASVVHLSKTSPPMIYGMDRTTYAKRWVELDFVSLVNDMVEVILLPAMQSSVNGHVAHAAALSSIRLVHACPHAPWVHEVCYWSILVLKEEFASQSSLEAKLTTLASLLICARAVPLPERSSTLNFCFEKIRDLPSTTMAPHGIHSSGLLLESRGMQHYRRPARVALLTEIVLSFFMDGPVESGESPNIRSGALEKFLKSAEVTSAFKETSTGKFSPLREELVTSFCMAAVGVGERHRSPPEGEKPTHLVVTASQSEFSEWIRMSLMVLNSFSGCIVWGHSPTYMEEELTLLVAAQSAYVRLVQEILYASGLLNPMCVSLRMSPTSSPPNMLWDQMEESAAFLGKCDTMSALSSQALLDRIQKLMDSLMKKELKGNGVVSHHMRLFLLSLAADEWVQGRCLTMRKEFESGSNGGQSNMKVDNASDLLTALSPRRVFSKVVEDNKSQIENYGKKKKELYKKYAQDTVTACVACIENIALTACDWRKRFGNNADIKNILNLAVMSLQGKSSGNDTDPNAPVLPVCQGAIERIQAAFSSNEQASIDIISLSPLLTSAGELKRRAVVTAYRSTQGRDSYHEVYLMQLSRQVIAFRIDRCVLSTPTVYSYRGAARKENWLRLAVSPLPASRNPQVSVASIPRFSWGANACTTSGGSDAATMTLAYSVRRNLRYDGENEFRLMVAMRVHNITAVEIPEGLRLELGIVQESATTSLEAQDPTSVEILKSLSEGDDDFTGETTLSSAMAVYKPELNSGDSLTWEIMMDTLPMSGAMRLNSSIVYRAMEDEPAHATWVGGDTKDGDGDNSSVLSGVSQKSLGSKADSNKGEGEDKLGSDQKHNITIPGEPMQLSPMIGLQPCPLVFFRDGRGDIGTFRFFWSRMPCQIPPLKLVPSPNSESIQVSYDAMRLSAISTIRFAGESIPGGFVTKLWAFMSLAGKRAFFVLAESEGATGSNDKTIHVRGDDKSLLCCLTGTSSARLALVATLAPGLQPL